MQNKLKMGNKLIIALTEVKKVSLLCICPARSLQGMPSIFDLKKKFVKRLASQLEATFTVSVLGYLYIKKFTVSDCLVKFPD